MGKGDKIGIERADDDAVVAVARLVETNEVLAVESQEDASFLRGKSQNLIVRHGPAGASCFLDGEDVMPEPPQRLNRGQGKVLVGVEFSHGQADSFAVICRSISSRSTR